MLVLVTFGQNTRPNLNITHGSIVRCTQINAQQVCCFCLQITNQLSRLTSSQFELQSSSPFLFSELKSNLMFLTKCQFKDSGPEADMICQKISLADEKGKIFGMCVHN